MKQVEMFCNTSTLPHSWIYLHRVFGLDSWEVVFVEFRNRCGPK